MGFNFDLTTPAKDTDGARLGFGSLEDSEESELGFQQFDDGDDDRSTTLGFNLRGDTTQPKPNLGFDLGGGKQATAPTESSVPDIQLTRLGEDYSIDNLAKYDGIAQLAASIMKDREGTARAEDETNGEVIERYMTHMRYVQNNTVDVFQEVDYVKGLSKRKKENYAIMMGIYDQMPNFMEEGGGSAVSGTLDIIGSLITDPVSLAGMAMGGPVGGAAATAARQAGKSILSKAVMGHILKNNLGRITLLTGLEGLTGAMHESQRQELNIEIGRMADKDWGNVALAGGLSASLSFVGAGVGAAASVGKKSAGIMSNAERTQRRLTDAKDPHMAAKARPLSKDMGIDPITGLPIVPFDKSAAERIRNSLGMPTAELSLQVNSDIHAATIAVAEHLMEALPDKYFRLTLASGKAEKASDTAVRIISGASEINDDIFEAALLRTGLTAEEFAKIERLTVNEAGTVMQLYKVMSDKMKVMGKNNPELKAKLDKIYGKKDELATARGTVWGWLKRLDRESRALMVTQIATTARNVISAGAAVTFGAAAKMMEGTLVHSYNSIAGAISGNAAKVPLKTGMMQTLDEATGAFRAIAGHRESMELAKLMLKDNTRLSQTLFRSLQETGNETLTKTTRFMNGLNMMQDQVVRSGAFTDSVNRQMKKLDLNMYDYIANNKPIPTAVLVKATDDALEMTFALMPHKGTVLRKFVEAAETIPFATTFVFPFARFMADAMAFQYKYSPANFVNAIGAYSSHKSLGKRSTSLFEEAASATRASKREGVAIKDKLGLESKAKKLELEAEALYGKSYRAKQDTADRIGKGVVGSGLLYAAVLYRNANQDTAWNTISNSSQPDQPIDIRAVFPMAPYLAVADLMVKWNNGELVGLDSAAQLLEGLTGTMLRPMGLMDSANDLIESLSQLKKDGESSGDIVTNEAVGKAMGNWAGSIMGRPLTSAQIFRDIYAAFDDTQATVRETRMVDGEGTGGVFAHTFMNHIKSKIPIWQEDLPEFRSPTTGGSVRRQSASMAQFSGIKYLPTPSEIEKEIGKLGIEPYKLNPKTGNKEADYYTRKAMPPYMDMLMGYTLASPYYKSQPNYKKKEIVMSQNREIIKIAKAVGEGEAKMDAYRKGEKVTQFDKARWAKTTAFERRLANEYFLTNYGKTVVELGAYGAGIKIGRALSGKF